MMKDLFLLSSSPRGLSCFSVSISFVATHHQYSMCSHHMASLLITFKYFRKYLLHILVLGFIISLSLAGWYSKNYPSLNFYILPTRGWELIAGSLLAYFEIDIYILKSSLNCDRDVSSVLIVRFFMKSTKGCFSL